MLLWVILAVLTAVVITAVGLPLVRPKADQHAPAQSDAEIYKAQLAEIEDERARGVLSDGEADAARIEISRRLLRATETAAPSAISGPPGKLNDRALAMICFSILAVALGGYLALGSPQLPQQPHATQAPLSPEARRVAGMVRQVEERLRAHPEDGAGWEVIAPVYLRQQKYHDAVFAFQQALRLNGESAARLEGLGEAMVLRDGGRVDEKARLAFARALRQNPDSLKARFWLAMGDEQTGNLAEAAAGYRKILEATPDGAPWRAMVGTRLAVVQQRLSPGEARAPALSPDARRSAEGMTEQQRTAMIENMVAGLAQRLEDDGNDLDGWLRLMRAYKVLGKQAEAEQAAASARENFAGDSDALNQIDAAARRLGLNS